VAADSGVDNGGDASSYREAAMLFPDDGPSSPDASCRSQDVAPAYAGVSPGYR